MGYLFRAACKCGYKSKELPTGVGFDSLETGVSYRLAYCEHCENVQSIDGREESPRCEKCNKLMTYYEDNFHEIPSLKGANPGEEHYWYCPACKTNSLQFTFAGLWD